METPLNNQLPGPKSFLRSQYFLPQSGACTSLHFPSQFHATPPLILRDFVITIFSRLKFLLLRSKYLPQHHDHEISQSVLPLKDRANFMHKHHKTHTHTHTPHHKHTHLHTHTHRPHTHTYTPNTHTHTYTPNTHTHIHTHQKHTHTPHTSTHIHTTHTYTHT